MFLALELFTFGIGRFVRFIARTSVVGLLTGSLILKQKCFSVPGTFLLTVKCFHVAIAHLNGNFC